MEKQRKSVKAGGVLIGNGAPISVESMTNTDTHDKKMTIAQVRELEKAGCDIVRLAVPALDAVETIREIKKEEIRVPIVADIHFDYRIAIACAEAGVDKVRMNPGEYRLARTCGGGCRRLPGTLNTDPDRRERRIAREEYSRKIRRTDSGSPRRKCDGTRQNSRRPEFR